ncbi:tRNA (guanosine(46)-N7)-methyltransferase TrmB [Kiritimatiellaeota bacterium B1221]|nr:tRNA (guanosine(46)-N7)-methyltransferase TrmB [Kiritimatiellaeota bacterium B1221]
MRSVPPVSDELSLRLWPDNWLGPMQLDDEWEQSGPRAIDLGCGKGRFLLAHAAHNPDMRLLGIERKLRRVRKIDRKAVRAGLSNIRLLRLEATYVMRYLIPDAWIDICYVYFPDPWPKDKHVDNRILSPGFLDILERTLSPQGVVHFATDHEPYFEQVCEFLSADPRWVATEPYVLQEDEVSDFELIHRDHKPIHRLSFQRKS